MTSAITIEGHGATIKRDVGRPRFRIFEINQGSLELRNTIIRNGHSYNYDSGGGISSNDSIVNLINSKVLNNRTDGESNGGGIHAFGGTVTLISSTVSGNSCYANGGGIDGINTIMTIINSTISNNTGGGFGSGISNFAFPENSSSLLTLINSTVSGNNGSAGVAIYNTRMEMKNSTVTENVSSSEYTGSGIMIRKGNRGEPKEFFLENSIIANNSGRDCSNNTTLTPVVKNTLIGDGGTNCGTPFLTGDPKLKPLRKNGGPTRTHALRADSPAIDTGDDAICATLPKNTRDQPTDQRGRSRTGPAAGPHCDIGAYEFRRRRRE